MSYFCVYGLGLELITENSPDSTRLGPDDPLYRAVVEKRFNKRFSTPLAQGNQGMLIQDPEIRERLREITFALIGEGESLE